MKPDLELILQRTAKAIAVLTAAAGLLVMFGWIFDIPSLKSVLPGMVTMKLNTALAFLMLGSSLYLKLEFPDNKLILRISQILSYLVLAIGAITIAEYIFNFPYFCIDHMFVEESPGAVLTTHPGRMAVTGALNLIFLPLALLLLDFKFGDERFPSHYLIVLTGMLSYIALLGYLFGINILLIMNFKFTTMALHTSILFLLLCIGMFAARPKNGITAVIISPTLPGRILRNLLPLALIIPPILGTLKLASQRFGIMSNEMGVALVALGNSYIFSIFIWKSIRAAYKIDIARERAETDAIRMRRAVQASGEVIFTTDRDGLIDYINPEFTRLYGFTADEVVGKATARILKSGVMKTEDYKHFWDTLLSKKVVNGEVINKCKDGRIITIEESANPILDDKGEITGFLAIQRDITKHKEEEAELAKEMKQLETMNKLMNEREDRIIELKNKISDLEGRLK